MNMKDVKSLGARIASGQKPNKQGGMIDSAAIRDLAELLTETGLTEIEIEQNGARIRVSRQSGVAMSAPVHAAHASSVSAPAATTESTAPKGPPAGAVPSPMVGTVYVAPEPGAQPFVKVGQTVKEGDTLASISRKFYKTSRRWKKILDANRKSIDNPAKLEVGQTLVIP